MAISNEERIARLEAGYEHLATKADIAEIRGEMAAKSHRRAASTASNPRVDWLFWAVIGIGGGLLAVAATALIRDVLV